MSDLRLDADALDPIVCNLGRFAGLLTKPSDNQIEFNTDWFASPYDGYLSQAFKGTGPKHAEQRAALLELVAASLGSSDPETLGLPVIEGLLIACFVLGAVLIYQVQNRTVLAAEPSRSSAEG